MAGWLTFDAPAWLVALPAAAGPLVAAAWGRRPGRAIPPAAIAAQCLALALVVAALAGPRAPLGRRAGLPYLLLVDASGSVRGQQDQIAPLAKQFPPGAAVERFDFAGRMVGPIPASAIPTEADAGSTEIAPVLRIIASRGPAAATVIVTDGRFTDQQWESLAPAAGASGPILLVPLDCPVPDARLTALTAHRQGGQVQLAATVVANAPLQRTLTIRRAGADRPLLVQPVALVPDFPSTVAAADPLPADAAAEYQAVLSAGDAITENDSAGILVVPLRQKLAAVGLEPPARRLLAGLAQPIVYLPHDKLPDRAEGLAEFSAVVLCDPTGQGLSLRQRQALAEYVSSGGGAVMLGTGPHDLPADENDPLNRVLPLLSNPYQRRPLKLLVVLDRSGSMSQPAEESAGRAGQRKFDLAAEAVLALKDHLAVEDSLAVVAFADAPEVVYDSGEGPPDFAALRAALGRVVPAGSTHVTPAMEVALKRVPVKQGKTPMLLIVSDLLTEDFPAQQWADNLKRAKIELAVVAIEANAASQPGDDAGGTSLPLETLAKLLNAPYVRQDRMAGLARVFASLVRAGRGQVVRTGNFPLTVVGPLFDTGLDALPEARAYVLSAIRKAPDGRAAAELLARTAGGDAVLARMPAGAGRSVSLALPLTGEQNADWRQSADAARLVTAAVRWAMRGDNDGRFDAALSRRGGRLQIVVAARQDDRPLNRQRLSAHVGALDQDVAVELPQTAPGKYEGAVPWPENRPASVNIRNAAGGIVWHGSAEALYPREYGELGADQQALHRLAELTGGKIVQAGQLADSLSRSYADRLTPLWPLLAAMALLLMLGDWCLTRVTRKVIGERRS